MDLPKLLDIFRSDAFSVVELTDAINKLKFVPGRIGALGLFQSTAVSTTTVAIEEKDGILGLVAPTPRGAPGSTLDKALRTIRDFRVPHFELNDAIMAEEVQNVRPFGQQTGLEVVQAKVAERLQIHLQSHAATEEYARIGAIKGVVTYAGGSSLNLNTEFGVTAQTEVDFDLDNASPVSGALRAKCASVVRTIQDELGGTPLGAVHAFCSADFYDLLISHPEVRDTYLGWAQAEELRTGYAYGAFPFGGIMWEEYRGSVDGTAFVAPAKCHIFPVGVPGLFRTYYAPADYVETVNTLGLPRYAKQYEMPNGKGIYLDTQMNSLSLCTRPRTLVQGRKT
jgi:hypothetical protein